METNEDTRKLGTPLTWFIIIAIASVVYAAGISHESLWVDEAFSSAMAGHRPGSIIRFIAHDLHPPLYYLLLRLVRVVLGNSEWALRSLSVVGAVGLVSLGPGPVRRIFGDRTAFIYTGVILFTPAILTYAHEARMYTLAIFSVSAAALYGYLAGQYGRASDWGSFAAATLTAAYLHYYGLIAVFFMHVWIFFWLLAKKRKHMKGYLITGAIVIVGYLPWLLVFVKQSLTVHRSFWVQPPTLDSVYVAFLQPFAYKEVFPGILPTMLLAFQVSLILVFAGIVIAARKRPQKELTLISFVLFAYLSTVLTVILASFLLKPIFLPRYLLVCVGLFLLLISMGISLLPGNYLPWAAVGIFALANIFTIRDIYIHKFNYPMRDLAEKLEGAIRPGDLIITTDSHSMGPAVYYFPQAVHYYSDNRIEPEWRSMLDPMVPPLHFEEGLEELLATHPSFWYISSNAAPIRDMTEILQGEDRCERFQESVTASEPYSLVAFTAQEYICTK